MNNQAYLTELEKLKLAYNMATEMSQLKASFLSRIAHEIKSPLSSILSSHQLILSNLCENPEEEREFINQSYNQGLKLAKLIDKIIMVSKIEQGREEMDIQPVNLTQLLQQLKDITDLPAKNRNLKVRIYEGENTEQIYILADERRLIQILVNILIHTIDTTPLGDINIKTEIDENQPCVNINIEGEFPPEFKSESIDLLQSSFKTTNNED
ncbi:MAG TPA: HAMP domain-containing sensor histidine kinase, partial [Allocoleopsis sp.]